MITTRTIRLLEDACTRLRQVGVHDDCACNEIAVLLAPSSTHTLDDGHGDTLLLLAGPNALIVYKILLARKSHD